MIHRMRIFIRMYDRLQGISNSLCKQMKYWYRLDFFFGGVIELFIDSGSILQIPMIEKRLH